jgi:hypothetical protein
VQRVADVGAQEHQAIVDLAVNQERPIVATALEIADAGAHDLDDAHCLEANTRSKRGYV